MKKNPNQKSRVAGWIISILVMLFLFFDSFGKLTKPEAVIQGTLDLGYPQSCITGLGVILLIATLLFAIPRTAFIGAVLLTGYLGGAVATHVRVENPLFSHILFPVYLGILIWLGIFLRDVRLRNLIMGKKA